MYKIRIWLTKIQRLPSLMIGYLVLTRRHLHSLFSISTAVAHIFTGVCCCCFVIIIIIDLAPISGILSPASVVGYLMIARWPEVKKNWKKLNSIINLFTELEFPPGRRHWACLCTLGNSESIAALPLGRCALRKYSFQVEKTLFLMVYCLFIFFLDALASHRPTMEIE